MSRWNAGGANRRVQVGFELFVPPHQGFQPQYPLSTSHPSGSQA